MKKWLLTGLCVLACHPLPAATIRLLSGELLEGKVDLGPRGVTILRATGPAVSLDLGAILEIAFRRPPPGAADTLPAGVLLSSGTIIAERNPPSLDDAAVVVGLEKIQVPTAAITWLLLSPVAQSKLDAVPAGQTGGLLEGGDFFPGTLVGMKAGRVSLNSVLFGPQTFALRTQIQAVCVRDAKPPLTRFYVTTVHGSRFATDDLRFETASLTLKDSVLGTLNFKVEILDSLRAAPGRYQALAEQKPFKVETRPGAEAAATLQVQKGGVESPDIVTTAANLAVTYTVPPGFTVFTSGISIPKNAAPNYRASFSVYGDGHPLFRTAPFSLADKPLPVRVDLRGARVVTLRVEPIGAAAGGGEWIAPMLLR
jgi:hypothetical protein